MKPSPGAPIGPEEIIVTPRCRLRYPHEADIPHIWSATRTPGFNDGLRWGAPARIEEIDEPFRHALAAWVSGEELSWTIEAREKHEFIGWISLRRETDARTWALGFWVHPRRQGRGFATESAAAVLKVGLTHLDARRITAAHATWNTASGRVLRKIGMRLVGTNPRGFRKDGQWVAEYEYEITPG